MTVTQLNRSMMNSAKWVFNILILFLLNLVFLVPHRHLITIAVENSTVETSAINIIKDGQLLISTNKNFALGFFSLNNSTNRRYVGIWYNDIPDLTIVWVANRDQPLNDDSGTFAIDTHGNLVIYSHTQNISLWSTNVSISSTMNDVSVQLLDTGNLQLIQKQNQNLLWQSFDYPSHTLLPYMKIGYDRRTGFSRFVTSWKARDDPGTGNFTLRIDPTGYPQLVLYQNDVPLWRAGTWTGRRFSGVPEMTTFFILTATYVDDADEVSLVNGVKEDGILTRMNLDESGFLSRTWRREKDRNWVEFWSGSNEWCDNYNRCGPNSNCDPYNPDQFQCTCLPGFQPRQPRDWSMRDPSGGCVRKRENATCQSGEGFVTVARVKVPDASKARADKNMRLEACREACLKDCNCTAYTSADVTTGIGCVTWYGDLIDTRTYANANVGQEMFVRVDAIELARYTQNSNHHSARNKVVTIVIVSIVATPLLLTTLVVYLWHKRRKRKEMQSLSNYFEGSPIPRELLGDQSRNTSDPLPVVFDLNTISKATDHFSFENKLGQGGFGSVYKGMLKSGEEIAVKRLAKNSGQGIGEFKNEVTLIAKLQHRNLVRILGYCVQHEEKMLVYEYLPNKSLDSFIFDESKRVLLDWTKRFEIIIGVARGILYLHQDSRLKIIHRDLKASNILLDGDLNPKIADFGMAKIFSNDQIQANTNRIVGTYGYMSPEYAMEGLFSEKSDVYSFGVVLLEIIAGRKNNSFKDAHNGINLVGYVWELWKLDKAMEIVDSTMDEHKSSFRNAILKCIRIGLLCVQDDLIDRPTMSTVVFMLSNEVTLPSPKNPLFILKRSNFIREDPSTSTTKGGSKSINDVTVSMLEAR